MGRNALEEENKRLRARIKQLEKQQSDAGWELEYSRQQQYYREQSERSKWGIFG